MGHVTKEQKAGLYRKLCQSGLSTAEIDEERTKIIRQLRSEGVSDRVERQTRMWALLAETHLGCDLDGNPLSVAARNGAVSISPQKTSLPQPSWPYRISRDEADSELEAGCGRTSSYATRVEWVSQHLDHLSARPSTAPCNAAWSMLIWATENRKEFYAQQRQFLSKGEQEGEEQRAVERDFKRFDELIKKFACWKRFDGKLEEMGVYTEVGPSKPFDQSS